MVGIDGEHLKLDLCQESTGQKSFSAIQHSVRLTILNTLKAEIHLTFVIHLEMNEFRGKQKSAIECQGHKNPG